MDALILAAGLASRFGLPKVLLPAGEGHTLLTRAVDQALAVVEGRVGVVLGRDADLARAILESWLGPEPSSRLVITENPHYAQGLSTSVKAGVAALAGSSATLVMLADQPAVSHAQLAALVAAWEPGLWAVCAAEGGEAKPPLVLGPVLLERVDRLEGDQGFKPLLKAHPQKVRLLEWGSGQWATDVDTWEAYQRLALELSWHLEPFEPLESAPKPTELWSWLLTHRPEVRLQLLRRAALGWLSGSGSGHLS